MTVNLNTIQLKSGSNEPPNGFLAINELGYSINQNQLYIGKEEEENIISIPIGGGSSNLDGGKPVTEYGGSGAIMGGGVDDS